MSFNVNSFKNSSFQQDFYRPNLFEVTIEGVPKVLSGVTDSDFKFMCKSASLPGETLTTVELNYMNRVVKIPGDLETPADAEFTVYNNQSMSLRAAFISWINIIQGRNSGRSASVESNVLVADFKITPFDRAGKPIPAGISVLKGGFPVSVGEIGLEWGNGGEPSEFSLGVSFNFWEGAGGDITI